MTIKKSLVSILIALIALIVLPNIVNAEVGDKFEDKGIEYTVQSEDTVIVSGCTEGITSVTIEESVTDVNTNTTYKVVAIGELAFLECETLTDLKIQGNSLKTIEERAFGLCYSLISVELPSSLETIGKSAFILCKNLTNINIPNSVKNIGDSAFCYCEKLKEIIIPNSIESIGVRAFEECDAITSINIPSTITAIPDRMVYSCNLLENITIPNSVTTIGEHAFSMCKSLKNITIPETVQSIETGAFSMSIALEKIKLPEGITAIDNATFFECTSLKEIEVPNSVKTIGDNSFWSCTSLEEIIIPSSVTTIGKDAFKNCTLLKIYATNDSVAKEYAKQNNLDFEALYKIVINKAKGVTIIPNSSITDLAKGSSVDIEIKANKGYKITEITVNGKTRSLSENMLKIENITEDKNVVIKTELINNNESSSINNPQTGDNILLYGMILVISVLGILSITKFGKNTK